MTFSTLMASLKVDYRVFFLAIFTNMAMEIGEMICKNQ